MSLVHYKPVNLFNQFNDEMNRHMSMTRENAANQDKCAWRMTVAHKTDFFLKTVEEILNMLHIRVRPHIMPFSK